MSRQLTPAWALVALITAAFAIVTWSAVEQYRSSGGDDEVAYRAYVDNLDANHRLPTPNENAEYALPPGVPMLGVWLEHAFAPVTPDRPSPILQGLPRLLRRLLWLGLVAGGVAALTRARPPAPRFLLGLGLLAAAAAWALAYVDAAADNEAWLPLVLIDEVSAVALVPLTALLAHEVWPSARAAPVLGAIGATLLPPVFAASLYFHPDPPFAVVAVAATAIALRAFRREPSIRLGVALGVVLGVAALTRQSAVLVAVVLLAGVALVARRAAARFTIAACVALLLVAGPWWLRQIRVYDNPFETNLNRPGYMLDGEPRSFYVSFPKELVTHPYHYSFQNTLLPRFHAYLWSDWGGNYHSWDEPKRFARALASTQSVLGFGADALVLGGVAGIGLPALLRATRGRARGPDAPLATMALLFLASWLAYLVTIVRFPQRDSDPVKAHYLLFLGPVAVVFAIAAAAMLVRRGGVARAATFAWVALFAVSWALSVATAF